MKTETIYKVELIEFCSKFPEIGFFSKSKFGILKGKGREKILRIAGKKFKGKNVWKNFLSCTPSRCVLCQRIY